MTPYLPPCTPYTCILYTYSHREGGRANQREGYYKARSKIATRLTVSPVYKLYKTPAKTKFWVWCLYSKLFQAAIKYVSLDLFNERRGGGASNRPQAFKTRYVEHTQNQLEIK
jgi:hypothetical protein